MKELIERVAEVVDRPEDKRETARDRLKKDAKRILKREAKKFLRRKAEKAKKQLAQRLRNELKSRVERRRKTPPTPKCPKGQKMVFGKCKKVDQ
tara:strand:+ start:127 stop:408 length:282 start_codon:yes stop_codon:yes gene_type:complete